MEHTYPYVDLSIMVEQHKCAIRLSSKEEALALIYNAKQQLMNGIDEDVFEEICAKVYETYLQNWDEAPNIWSLADEELKARGLK